MTRILFILLIFFFVQNESFAQNTHQLNILSWNVFLRPAFLQDDQMERVDSIANYLLNSQADVLVLQEVFHKKAKRKLIKQLKSQYHFASVTGKKSFWGVPSGVLILSKHQIITEKHVNFKAATGSDKMACKGGISTIIDFFGYKIQIIGTHLQAGKGDKRNRIRRKQLRTLKTIEDSTTTASIYVGDFNITMESEHYAQMMKSLECENINPLGEKQSTANFSDNELYPTSGKSKWIDFILLRKSRKAKLLKSTIEEPKSRIKNRLSRLSDHNPIISTIVVN